MLKKAVTAEEMKKIDQAAIQDFGISSLVLMENAGRGVAEVAFGMLPKESKEVVIVCGKGNNGGDGFVCARHLINKGADVTVFLVGGPDQNKGDAKVNFLILEKMKTNFCSLIREDDFDKLKICLKNSDLIIDAIFGIGLSGKIREPYLKIIDMINKSGKKVLSVDIPSGLDADKGISLGGCVRADKTTTFAVSKVGLIKEEGLKFCGDIITVDISIPKRLLEE